MFFRPTIVKTEYWQKQKKNTSGKNFFTFLLYLKVNRKNCTDKNCSFSSKEMAIPFLLPSKCVFYQ